MTRRILMALCLLAGCRPTTYNPPPIVETAAEPRILASAQEVREFCGDCHKTPAPSSYAKMHWQDEVRRGFEFYEVSGRDDLHVPIEEQVVNYYESLAPQQLVLPKPQVDLDTSPLRFSKATLPPTLGKAKPACAHVYFHETEAGHTIFAVDAMNGEVHRIVCNEQSGFETNEVLATLKAPAHIESHDLFGQGKEGLLVADLGTFGPDDHALGGLFFLLPHKAEFKTLNLLTDIGRLADFAVADFNADGVQDIALAEFGYQSTGCTRLLLGVPDRKLPDAATMRNQQSGEGLFTASVIDGRHGTSHILARDVDQDGDVDLISLCSQEYESVDLFLNDGQAHFEKKQLWSAEVPSYGCSSMMSADIDGDGDLDIVFTNGDSMDSNVLKPHHGLQWLENRCAWEDGKLQFEYHRVADIVGAYGCDVGDLDQDGDQDLVVCTMTWKNEENNSVSWFEQVTTEQAGVTFKRHSLDLSLDQHPSIELGDFDGDGDLDIAAGELEMWIELPVWLNIYWNEGFKDSADKGNGNSVVASRNHE